MAPLLKGFVPALAAPTGVTFEVSPELSVEVSPELSVEPLYSSIDYGGGERRTTILTGCQS